MPLRGRRASYLCLVRAQLGKGGRWARRRAQCNSSPEPGDSWPFVPHGTVALKSALRVMRVNVGRWLAGIFASLLQLHCATAQAELVTLDTTVLTFVASGSPNTITGTWTASNALSAAAAPSVAYLVELVSLDSTFPAFPVNVNLFSTAGSSSVGLHFCTPISALCLADSVLGASATITADTALGDGAWSFLGRLVDGATDSVLAGNASVVFTQGGTSASVVGTVRVTLLAESTAFVTEPPTSALLVVALVAAVAGNRRPRVIRRRHLPSVS